MSAQMTESDKPMMSIARSWGVLLLAGFLCRFSEARAERSNNANSTGYGSVEGRVKQEGKPAGFVNVVVIGTRIGTSSREDGSFELPRVPVGSRVIQFQTPYCTKASVSVEVRSGATDTVTVDLECPLMCSNTQRVTADC